MTLRELPGAFQTRDNFIKLELGVFDSGKVRTARIRTDMNIYLFIRE